MTKYVALSSSLWRLTDGRWTSVHYARRYFLGVLHLLSTLNTRSEDTMAMISQSTMPGAYLVDLFPQSQSHEPGVYPFADMQQ